MPENENSSLSNLYPDVDKALREAGLLKGKQNTLDSAQYWKRYKDSSREKGKNEKG